MRYSVPAALAAALIWTALALLLLQVDMPTAELKSGPASETEAAYTTTPTDEPTPEPENTELDTAYLLSVQTEDGIRSMDMRSYLTGVVLAEMPLSFGAEALKAQAVACRTYTLARCSTKRHGEAAVCTDSRCCQAWLDPADAEPKARERAESAVRDTDGLVLLYRGELIDATFFSCSGGRTEDAAAVWGNDRPYLKAISSPGEEDAAHYTDEVRVPLADFCATLSELDGEVSFSGSPATWVEAVQYTAGGGVEHLKIGGSFFRGTSLRKAFSLRSTSFRLSLTEGEAVFSTRGNGHRVGMSQYGANAMAKAGNDFETILKWYYQGVELAKSDIP